MIIRVYCDNKDCRKEMNPVVDKETLVAYCTECGKEINNISIFMRRQMAAEGLIRKNEKRKLPWAVKCPSCTKEAPPVLKGDKFFCCFCDKEIDNLSRPFQIMLKEHLQKKVIDE